MYILYLFVYPCMHITTKCACMYHTATGFSGAGTCRSISANSRTRKNEQGHVTMENCSRYGFQVIEEQTMHAHTGKSGQNSTKVSHVGQQWHIMLHGQGAGTVPPFLLSKIGPAFFSKKPVLFSTLKRQNVRRREEGGGVFGGGRMSK